MPFPPPPKKTTYFHLRNASPCDIGPAMSSGYINHKAIDIHKLCKLINVVAYCHHHNIY